MSCEKHPDKESVANCAVCGKSICEECLIKIAGKSYCKDCVNELVTESILKNHKKEKEETAEIPEEPKKESEELEELEPIETTNKPKFRSATNVSTILEEEGLIEETKPETPTTTEEISTGEYTETTETPKIDESSDEDLEAKYEKYLEDLYYDEPKKQETIETPQTITDEYTEEPKPTNTNIGITGEYTEEPQTITGEYNYPKEKEEDIIVPAHAQRQEDEGLSYEEIRSRILTETPEEKFRQDFEEQQRAYERELIEEPVAETAGYTAGSLYYDDIVNREPKEKKEKRKKDDGFTKGEIVLCIILIILIIIVMSYVIYLFTLSNDYPSYFDAVRVLFTNPAQLFENIVG